MRKITVMFFLAMVLAALSITGADNDYVWPIKLVPDLSSRFCDHRSGHFHAGLDFRTKGKSGFRIYAIDDGYIYRVSVSHYGYGKALYLRLKDGKIVVYGHLSSLGEEMDEVIRKKQMKDKKYHQDLFFKPGEYPVTNGQNIGLTGESGSGSAHLHFEIRSSDNFPINPLKNGFSIKDNTPPVFEKLAVRYYDDVFSPGNPCNIEFPEIDRRGEEYLVPDTLIGTGEIALAVSGGDLVDGKNSIYGFYGLKMFVDDSLAFLMKSDSISYETTGQIDYIRDLEMYSIARNPGNSDNDEGIFYRLQVPPGAGQYFYPGFEDYDGIIKMPENPGEVKMVKIEAADESGNSSFLTLFIKSPELPSPPPDFISYYKFADTIEVDFLSQDEIANVNMELKNSPTDPFKKIDSEILSKTWRNAGKIAYLNTIRIINQYKEKEYRFRFSAADGGISRWIFFKDAGDLSGLQVYGSPDRLRIDYYPDSIYTDLVVQIQTEAVTFDLSMYERGIGLFSTDIINREIYGPTSVSIKKGSQVVIDTIVSVYPVYPGVRTTAYSSDFSLKVEFDRGSAFYPVYVMPSVASKAVIMGKDASVYEIRPLHLIANSPLQYEFDLLKSGVSPNKLGAYGYVEKSGRWGFIEKAEGSRIEFPGMGLGRIALIADDTPPTISTVRPRGRIRSRRPVLSCVIRDAVSGVELDSGLAMKIDGIWIPAEYDSDTKKFRYKVKNSLRAGRHKLEITASDKQGNKTEKTTHFTILGR
jgi:hypothetical protein